MKQALSLFVTFYLALHVLANYSRVRISLHMLCPKLQPFHNGMAVAISILGWIALSILAAVVIRGLNL